MRHPLLTDIDRRWINRAWEIREPVHLSIFMTFQTMLQPYSHIRILSFLSIVIVGMQTMYPTPISAHNDLKACEISTIKANWHGHSFLYI